MTFLNQNESRYPMILGICDIDHGLTSFAFFFLLLHVSPPSVTAQLVENQPNPAAPGPFSGSAFDKPMAIITVVLVVAFFTVGFISVYTGHCRQRRIRGTLDLGIHLGASDRRSDGLDPRVIETLPTFAYSAVKALKIGRGTLECAVCLNEFRDDETLRLIPKCNHVFHSHCIDVWLSSHSTCPVCRANLVPRLDDMFVAAVQIPDPGVESNESNTITEREENQNMDTTRENQKRGIDPSQSTDQNCLPPSRSNGFSLPALFRRSYSTGNSLVQPGKDTERYTLRLPEEVRSQLLNSTLIRAKSCVTFTRMSSGRMDYRARSGGGHGGSNYLQNERFGGEGRWTPPFFSRGGSSRSGKGVASGVAMDNIEGERSTDRLFAGAEV